MLQELEAIVGADGVTAGPPALVLPRTTQEVAQVVQLCAARGVLFAPRGGDTGAADELPPVGGVVIGMARMNRILETDLRNRCLTAQAGVRNGELNRAVAADGYLIAPGSDVSDSDTLGGSIALGTSEAQVLAVELVLPDGTAVTLGDKTVDTNGYDLLSLVVGPQGTLGIITQATVRLFRAKTLTGGRDIGAENRDAKALTSSPEALRTMAVLRAVFDPVGVCKPG